MKPAIRYIILALLALAPAGLAGCADGFTNGSIPPGRSAVKGKIVHAENPLLPVPNAIVTLVTSPNNVTQTFSVYSDANGNFELDSIPTGPVSSDVTLSVNANDPSFQRQKVSFILTNKRTADVIVALPQASFSLSQVATVNLVPQGSVSSSTAQFKTNVLDANGNSLNITPTLIFDGGVGVISPDGTITVTANTASPIVALGNITATIDTGAASAPTVSAPILSNSHTTVSSNPTTGNKPPLRTSAGS